MSSTGPPTKSWWSLYKTSSNKELRQNYVDVKSDRRSSNLPKHSSGLKSIAVAIGLRSKRPSREPLCPATSSQASDTSSGQKSPSPTLSPVDSFDTRRLRPRQSLLTIADDPFAGHPPVVSIRHSPAPSRFSVYSSPSVTDLASKTDSPVYRSSYGSSSTNSNSLGPDLNSTTTSSSHLTFPESKKLHLKYVSGFSVWNRIHQLHNRRSIGSMQVRLPDDLLLQTSLMPSLSRSAKESPVDDEPIARPKLRSRGMTVGGLPQKSGFFVKEQTTRRKLSQASSTSKSIPASVKPSEPSKSLLPVRQSSFSSSRIVAPPTAPPSVGLPAPPQPIPEQPNFHHRKRMSSLPFSSSSQPSLFNDHNTSLHPIHDDGRPSNQNSPSDDCSFGGSVEPSSKTAPSSPRTLKKLPSQRSLRPASSPTTTHDSSEKRKQRNSQQCRLPMPTLSLSIRTSFVTTQPRNGDTPPHSITDQWKSRKRLFSTGSQRPSTLTRVPASLREDDASSESSHISDHDTIQTSYKPWVVTRNYPKPSSFWDEGTDTTPNSPAPHIVDYQPQAIMSRDELAKLEESISNINPEQEIPLGSTLSFPHSNGSKEFEQEPMFSPLHSMKPEPSSGWSSDATPASSTSRSRIARRPITADPLGRDSSKEAEFGSVESRRLTNFAGSRLDIMPDSTSLPPPPRRRLLSSNSVRSTASTSTTSTLVPSPVERLHYSKVKLLDRPNTLITTTPLQPSSLGTRSLPTSSPPAPRSISTSRGKIRTSGVLEKAIHRRSIMRKPSFLEIDDGETDPESEAEVVEKRDSLFLNMNPPSATVVNGSSKTGESFLDLARESLDTVRS
jgi:hypothetical protein